MSTSNTLEGILSQYRNSAYNNDLVWINFTRRTDKFPFLKEHRDFIEKNNLGFGDRAFHYMWYLLISHLVLKNGHPKVLEIGVYKGQVISLWALIAKYLNSTIDIVAVSPFTGNISNNVFLNNPFVNKVRGYISQKFIQNQKVGNYHPRQDYFSIIREVFEHFELNFDEVNKIKGYSNSEPVLKCIKDMHLDIVYIDGDHSYDAVVKDIQNYSSLIKPSGFLVMDDASYFLPGNQFWKGYEEVSRACAIIEDLGFTNVLNVGHNRIYQKI